MVWNPVFSITDLICSIEYIIYCIIFFKFIKGYVCFGINVMYLCYLSYYVYVLSECVSD